MTEHLFEAVVDLLRERPTAETPVPDRALWLCRLADALECTEHESVAEQAEAARDAVAHLVSGELAAVLALGGDL